MKKLKIISVSIILVLSILIISSCGQSNKPVTIQELAAKKNAQVGALNKTYKINTNYTYPDGSYIFVNFQSVKKYTEYTNNKGENINNVIIIALENGAPVQENSNLASKARYLGAFIRVFDNMGKELNLENISIQTNKESYEAIVEVAEVNECAFLVIGGFDESSTGKSQLIYPLN